MNRQHSGCSGNTLAVRRISPLENCQSISNKNVWLHPAAPISVTSKRNNVGVGWYCTHQTAGMSPQIRPTLRHKRNKSPIIPPKPITLPQDDVTFVSLGYYSILDQNQLRLTKNRSKEREPPTKTRREERPDTTAPRHFPRQSARCGSAPIAQTSPRTHPSAAVRHAPRRKGGLHVSAENWNSGRVD